MSRYGDRVFPDLETRFIVKVDVSDAGCWEWQGHVDVNGYGVFGVGDRRLKKAHRYSYERFVGDVPDGLVLDHLCRNRKCVNPNHLEPVTNRENVTRGFKSRSPQRECKRGHRFTEANTYIDPRGYRCCRACRKLAAKRHKEKNKCAA